MLQLLGMIINNEALNSFCKVNARQSLSELIFEPIYFVGSGAPGGFNFLNGM